MSKISKKYNNNPTKRQKKHVCLPLAIKAKQDHWQQSFIFFEYLKTQFQTSRIYKYTAQSLHTELKSRGYKGSQRTVERHVKVLRSKGLAYKKDYHLYLISERKCYEFAGCNHKVHPSKHLADYILKEYSGYFDIPELTKELTGKSDPAGDRYTAGRIKNNIRHLSVKGFLKYDSDRELYELRKELYKKRYYRLINQFHHTLILRKDDNVETIKEKIITATLKIASEQKRYFVNTDLHNDGLTRATGRKKTQREVKNEIPQSNSLRELARFTNYSKNTIQKHVQNALKKGWMQRVKQHPEQLKDCFGAVKMPEYIFHKRIKELKKRTKGHVYLEKGIVNYIRPDSLIFKQLIFS